MEKLNLKRVEEITTMLVDAGFNGDRIKKMERKISTSSLPSEGQFSTIIINKDSENAAFHFLQLGVVGTDHKVSLSRLRNPISKDNKETVSKSGKFILKVSAINKQFSEMSTIETAAFLEGKKFKATKVSGYIRPFDQAENKQMLFPTKEACLEASEPYDTWQIEIIENQPVETQP